ncbi:ferredoxin--NADP reductase [Aestuariibaculum lutulentum]|uniref:Ferredoxin--NADP reductase n=1 Tax=Aestuariibaculum lutulentum TaxID=2920935 RepID=A0ABS9RIR3_9FLAO|nr:ferredoxin--NADP reductase [Aestuariibaculum lutulentum]MCH4552846.1 ferredoxin--NADP reductase [Aestuariibaculum lutulentum]
MKLLVTDIIKETDDALSVCFKNGNIFNKLKYKPGQFLTIHVPINGQIYKRAYSFSSSPYIDRDLKITIKRVDKGIVSNFVHDNLKVGDKLEVDKPMGSFFVEPKKGEAKTYVFFAGGSGITPIYSIIQSILVKEVDSKVLLFYANQTQSSIIFAEEIKQLSNIYPDQFKVEHIVSNLNLKAENYHQGFLSNTILTSVFSKHKLEFDDYVYMVCGPFGYMEKVKELLNLNGITREKIKVEVFKLPKVKVTGKDLLSNVTIKIKDQSYGIKVRGDKSILQQAMSENIAIPYSCRSGMCSTCKATCVSGDIKMVEGHILEQSEVDQGKILTCVSYPESESVVIEF